MNRITKLVNLIDAWLAPLGELAKDEQFRGEVLAAAGAKEKKSAAGKAKTKEKLNKLLQLLDDLRKKLDLDKSDVPNVSNIVALGMLLAELYVVFKALHEVLASCDYFGLEDEDTDVPSEDKETAIINAIRAISRFLTQNVLQKKAPAVAAWAEAAGVFSDEYNETKRALDLVFFPLLAGTNKITGFFDANFNTDLLRPVGDIRGDDHLRITKGIFLILSVISLIAESKIKPAGRFLFNFGHELPPAKDPFPLAGSVAGRVLQMQFIPGAYFDPKQDEWIGDELFGAAFRDSFLSFATIPVFPPDAKADTPPLGFQYLLGLELNPGGPGEAVEEPGTRRSRLSLTFPANFVGTLIWGHGIGLTAFNSDPLGEGPLLVARLAAAANGKAVEASDLSSGDISFSIEAKKTQINGQPKDDAVFKLAFHDISFSLSGEGRDGFLQKILPDNGAAQIKASLSVVYSALQDKWTLEGIDGNEGLLLHFKVSKTLFGKLEIPTLYLGLMPFLDAQQAVRGVKLESSAMLKLALGPFLVVVDRLGLYSSLTFPEKADGNLGAADFDLGFKPPTGVGFLVQASVVKGGGFLSLDPENNQYYGAGELNIEFEGRKNKYGLTLKVFAIILTKLPDGTKGFSFLLMASIEFDPGLETAFGFKVKGVGVLVALHRAMNLEAFREAVRDDRFNSILFPDNPVGNAPAIVKTMNSLFPVVQDRYVFAVMAWIGWGTRNLVDLKLGLLIEVPNPVTLALVGVVKVTVKEAGKQILNLQVNFLIALDLGKKMFSIDAAVYNSKLLIFDIRGEMFLRYRWGTDPVFLFSLGGWHPDFQVPSGLNLPAKPQRVTIPLLKRENLTLILSCYFAVTSNTVQAGFAIDFKIKWSKFRLEAGLSVDALFHFNPFYFIVDFEGKLRIFWGSNRLAGVTVKGKFSGTHPWRIQGKATFEIWIWDYDVDFDESTGEELTAITQEVEVLPLLEQAIRDKGNWQVTMPAAHTPHIILRSTDKDPKGPEEPAAAPLLADPLAQLEVMQQVAPMGIRIDKLGFQRVKDFRKFDLAADTQDGQQLAGNDLDDFFAPAMFLELKDAEKLSRKSFEPMKAGQSFGETATLSCGEAQITPFEYDSTLYDPLAPAAKPAPPVVPETYFQQWMAGNSVARSAEGRKFTARQEMEARKPLVKTDPFVLADATSGNKLADVPGQKSMTGAYYELWKINKLNPLRQVKVIRESELAS